MCLPSQSSQVREKPSVHWTWSVFTYFCCKMWNSRLRCWFVAPLVVLVMFRRNQNLWNPNSELKALDSVFRHRSTWPTTSLSAGRTVGQDVLWRHMTREKALELSSEWQQVWGFHLLMKARIRKAAETLWVKSSWLIYNHAWGWWRGVEGVVSSLQFQEERFCFTTSPVDKVQTNVNRFKRPQVPSYYSWWVMWFLATCLYDWPMHVKNGCIFVWVFLQTY